MLGHLSAAATASTFPPLICSETLGPQLDSTDHTGSLPGGSAITDLDLQLTNAGIDVYVQGVEFQAKSEKT